ncbi:hypothetical protein [uncultured Gammaproteobacteria bacterium]|jgi:hypothetical protein|nr:hypothetical protein [uncultured Gammaproteobacteria bacterium]
MKINKKRRLVEYCGGASASAKIISDALGEKRYRQQVSLWCTTKKPMPIKCMKILLEHLREDNIERRSFYKNAKNKDFL